MISYRLYGKLNIKDIKKTFDVVCKITNNTLKIKQHLEFDVNIVSKAKIKKINKTYRHKDKVTDVISFAYWDNKEVITPLLGEIYICLDKAKSQANEYGHSLKREVAFLFTHGLLHLLGYDHIKPTDEKKMFGLTKQILKKIKI